jgi:hypothetical protein
MQSECERDVLNPLSFSARADPPNGYLVLPWSGKTHTCDAALADHVGQGQFARVARHTS